MFLVKYSKIRLPRSVYIIVIFLTFSSSLSFATINTYGIIQDAEGRIEVMAEGSVLWKSVTDGSRIRHNDRIRTFKASGCTIFFLDSSYVSLQEQSGLLYNNSIRENAEVVERIFSSIYGSFYFSLSQKSTKGESHNWIKVSGLELQAQSSALHIEARDSLVTVRVDSESIWAKGKMFKEILALKEHQITYVPHTGVGNILAIPRKIYADTQAVVVADVSAVEKKIDLSQERIVITGIQFNQDSLQNIGRWDIVEYIERSLLKAFAGESLSVRRYKQSIEQAVELPIGYSDATLMIKEHLKVFKIEELPTEVRLTCTMEIELIEAQSGYSLMTIPLHKYYSQPNDDRNNMRLLKFLPLDMTNKKINNSILKTFFDDVGVELIHHIKNPL